MKDNLYDRRSHWQGWITFLLVMATVIALAVIATSCSAKDDPDIFAGDWYLDENYQVVVGHRPYELSDDVNHPDNEEFRVEVAFNLDIPVDSVTQEQFNARYGL